MQLFGRKRETREHLRAELKYYWGQLAYVKSTQRLDRMEKYLQLAQQHQDENHPTEGFEALNRAKRELMLARTKGQVYYHRNVSGMVFAAMLVALFSLGLLALWLLQDQAVSGLVLNRQALGGASLALTMAPFLAALGGGIGGCAAVLIQAIDVNPDSEVVSKSLWYVVKPVLGAALGLITYFAVVSGLSLLATGAKVDNFAGTVVIGFLAGFFESFSTGILARIAGQFTQAEAAQEHEDVPVPAAAQPGPAEENSRHVQPATNRA